MVKITFPKMIRLRHTFGSHMAMAGADPVAIMRAMGHSDIKTTMIYVSLGKNRFLASRPDFAKKGNQASRRFPIEIYDGAEGGTRTPTGFPTTPSRCRVCMFQLFPT